MSEKTQTQRDEGIVSNYTANEMLGGAFSPTGVFGPRAALEIQRNASLME